MNQATHQSETQSTPVNHSTAQPTKSCVKILGGSTALFGHVSKEGFASPWWAASCSFEKLIQKRLFFLQEIAVPFKPTPRKGSTPPKKLATHGDPMAAFQPTQASAPRRAPRSLRSRWVLRLRWSSGTRRRQPTRAAGRKTRFCSSALSHPFFGGRFPY